MFLGLPGAFFLLLNTALSPCASPLLPSYREWVARVLKAGAPVPTDGHEVRPLDGLKICVTGLKKDMRDRVEALCKQHGGTYARDLDKECTHLLALPCMTYHRNTVLNPKIKAALQWDVSVISHQWLEQQIELNGIRGVRRARKRGLRQV